MTHLQRDTPLEHHTRDRATDTSAQADASRPTRNAAIIAGTGLLLLAALAGYANLAVLQALVTPGDPARTASDIAASEGLFRLGVASLYVAVVLDVVIAWALFGFFSPVSPNVARLAAWLRLAYAVVFAVAIGQLAGIPDLLNSDRYSSAFTPEQLQAQVLMWTEAFNDVWMAGLVLFGAHLVAIGYLAHRSGYVPQVLGVLLVIAGVGYVFDSFVSVFSGGSPFAVSTVTFLGELLLAIWLVVRGRHVASGTAGHVI